MPTISTTSNHFAISGNLLEFMNNLATNNRNNQDGYSDQLSAWENEPCVNSADRTLIARQVRRELSIGLPLIVLELEGLATTSFPPLPTSITQVELRNCSDFSSLLNLPASVTNLTITDSAAIIGNLPTFSDSLKQLTISYCNSLQSLSNFPGSLEILEIVHCPLLENLPDFSLCLRQLTITDCSKLQRLPELPPLLENNSIHIMNCMRLQNPPAFLPILPASQIHAQSNANGTRDNTEDIQRLLSSIYPDEMEQLLPQWMEYQRDNSDAMLFLTFIETLCEESAEENDRDYSPSIRKLFGVIQADPATRQQLFSIAQGSTTDCHDRRIWTLNTMLFLVQLSCFSRDNGSPDNKTALFELLRGQCRQNWLMEYVDRIIADVIAEGKSAATLKNESLEVYLFLSQRLKDELRLPHEVTMVNELFTETILNGVGRTPESTLDAAKAYVKNKELHSESLVEQLISEPTWCGYLLQNPDTEEGFEFQVNSRNRMSMSKLDQDLGNGKIDDAQYETAAKRISQTRDEMAADFFRNVTRGIMQRLR